MWHHCRGPDRRGTATPRRVAAEFTGRGRRAEENPWEFTSSGRAEGESPDEFLSELIFPSSL